MASFSIVPVLDLKGGEVVQARAGDRANYRPIRTPLADGSAPEAVLEGLLRLAPFRRFYVADLDAIEGRGSDRALIESLTRRHDDVEFWVDGGIATADAAAVLADAGAVPVLGSETLRSAEELAAASGRLGAAGCVLSLDYRGERFLGPGAIEGDASLWPERVIVMTLARIGGDAGPDVARLSQVQRRAGGRAVFGAGGVRGPADVAALLEMRLGGVLVATALHDGRLDRAAIAALDTQR
jgi:phosphoribosylformimino-5-aminoimidazole carboxamide ribotide isomerase